ncbi:hypothetical protein OEG86_19850 [Hoeflea alexandrii]|uniref:hypothetical protein n=1 Tax=Hoeflea alexandrii TaxID=288436 RepID=UPI0022710B2B|nr:hypothetical protein [Hoeflea alexandrii]MCY0154109.1 hypothetical protein [Hoeflea alexandrii]
MVEPVKLKLATARMLTPSIREMEFVRSDGGTLASYTPGAHVKFALLGRRTLLFADRF